MLPDTCKSGPEAITLPYDCPIKRQDSAMPFADRVLTAGRAYELERAAAGTPGFDFWATVSNPWTDAILGDTSSFKMQ